MNQTLRKQTSNGKIIVPRRTDAWDIAEIVLAWTLTILAISVVAVCWHDGGTGLGMLTAASAAIVIWKEGPWKKTK